MRVSGKMIHFYSHTIEWPITKSNRLRPDSETVAGLSRLIEKHLGYMLSKRLRSSEFPVPERIMQAG